VPDIAVPTALPTASFLALGAPVAVDSAVSADFAAILVQQDTEMVVPALPEAGKDLPAVRQDLAALPLPVAGDGERHQPEPLKPIMADLPKALAIRSSQAGKAVGKPQPIVAQAIQAETAPVIVTLDETVEADAPRNESKALVADAPTPDAPIKIARHDKTVEAIEVDSTEQDTDGEHTDDTLAVAPIIIVRHDKAIDAVDADTDEARDGDKQHAPDTTKAAPIIVTLPAARPVDAPVPARNAAVKTPVTAQPAPTDATRAVPAAALTPASERKIDLPAKPIPAAAIATLVARPVEAVAARMAAAQTTAFFARPVAAAEVTERPAAAPVPAKSVTFTMPSVTATPAAPAIETVAAPVPTATRIAARQAAQAIEGAPIDAVIADAPKVEPVTVAPVAIATTTPPPAAEARAVAFAALAEGFGQPVAAKSKLRDAAIAVTTDTALATPAPTDVRIVQAANPPAAVEPIGVRAAAMIETIEALRIDARSASLDVSIRHEDFGPMTLNFEQTDDKVTVRVHTRDAELARMIADAAPTLKSAGEPIGIRVERRDAPGAGVDGSRGGAEGGSQDAPRQGRDQGRGQSLVQQSQHRATRGRGGIFA
jgi:hypothetical protein